ncbi:MAG: hypothetical protein HY023_05845, partial [Chloroflexi bacterium]|nr:hypothetical protein [Chloroflexota bacterium]
GVLDAQALIGLILLVGLAVSEGLSPNRILHALIMFFAVAAAHQTARWCEAPDARKFRNGLIAYGLSFVLILLGIVVIVRAS